MMPKLNLQTPIQYVKGVGPAMAQKMARLKIETVLDLLFYYPRDYYNFTEPLKIAQLQRQNAGVILGKVIQISNKPSPRKHLNITKATIEDSDGDQIEAIWFNQPFLARMIKINQTYLFFGKVDFNFQQGKYLSSPMIETKKMILPIYSETAGLNSKYLRKIVDNLKLAIKLVPDYLPDSVQKEQNLITLPQAILKIHFPQNNHEIITAKKRLAFDELFLIALNHEIKRAKVRQNSSYEIATDQELLKKFVKSLPFKLTNEQKKASWQIILDLAKKRPMNRLLQGDVGSGKTVVAAMASLLVIKQGYQAVWLAPTEVLASQHFGNLQRLLKVFGVKIGLITSSRCELTSSKLKAQNSKQISNLKSQISNQADLIIGTHAVIQKEVHFPRLALVIVDEQHRFGVKQRAALKQANANEQKSTRLIPHFLSMTATPIPRTLTIALFGDLDISYIKEKPHGRKEIKTKIVAPANRGQAYDFIAKQIKVGRQAFVICPLIEKASKATKDSKAAKAGTFGFDYDNRKAAVEEYQKLSQQIFPDFKVGLLHGRMKSAEKQKTMAQFSAGQIDILVATAVVEVGVDVPNATIMMIEGAERFGLAQLHQFRGRVGRSDHQSYCMLFTSLNSDKIAERLNALEQNNDGFALAEIDLKLRGPGELAGTMQSGLPDLKMASLTDLDLMQKAREMAQKVVATGLENYPNLRDKVREWEKESHLE